MIYALYGSHGEYAQSIIQEGVTRPTAAYFVLPQPVDPARLHATLCCAVFHAIGLQVLDRACRDRSPLSLQTEQVGGIRLFLFPLEEDREFPLLDTYRYGAHTSYPYARVSCCGAVSALPVAQLRVPDELFAQPIAGAGEQQRFFQKNGGRQQVLHGCDMHVLEQLCNAAATWVEPQLNALFGRSITGR